MYREGNKVRVLALVPVEVYQILERERGLISMSSFAATLLSSYTDFVMEEENGENKVNESFETI